MPVKRVPRFRFKARFLRTVGDQNFFAEFVATFELVLASECKEHSRVEHILTASRLVRNHLEQVVAAELIDAAFDNIFIDCMTLSCLEIWNHIIGIHNALVLR